MKYKFTKNLGRVRENLELSFEENWIYVHYTKGSFEKTSCLLNNENKSEEEYLDGFFAENNVSDEMKNEVKKLFKSEIIHNSAHWNEFKTFLIKTLSLNMVFGISVAVCVFGGYKLGSIIDDRNHLSPLFTLIGTFLGIGIGGVTIFSMIQKYFKSSVELAAENDQKQFIKNPETSDEKNYPIIDVTIEVVRNAVRTFSEHLPKGVYRTILIKEDNSIDLQQLAAILGGTPSKNFYMSKETYDLFEESEKHIPIEMDIVQKAVDQYVKDNKQYPMLQFDPQHRVNYYQLLEGHYLKTAPEIQFYITDLDGLITHICPKKKTSSQF